MKPASGPSVLPTQAVPWAAAWSAPEDVHPSQWAGLLEGSDGATPAQSPFRHTLGLPLTILDCSSSQKQ